MPQRPRGLPWLAELMPGAGHLVHMPGHIFIRVGRYADAIEANQHAAHADASYLEGPVASRRGIYANGYYPHNWHFLSFAASMSARPTPCRRAGGTTNKSFKIHARRAPMDVNVG